MATVTNETREKSLNFLEEIIEESIAKGGAPVNIPDFTNGKWLLPRHDYFDDFQ